MNAATDNPTQVTDQTAEDGGSPLRDNPLDLTGPLPSGTVVLEASAGTGKTYAIAALATRAVAEGRCKLHELLIVTFTRAATAELRERIRTRLTQAERHLTACLAGAAPDANGDDVLTYLADAPTEELRARRDRLGVALTDFDAATISTIHGFTQQVLTSVGLSVDVPREITLLEDDRPLLEEVVDDVYLKRYLGRADLPTRPKYGDVVMLARLVASHPDADLRPEPQHYLGTEGEDTEIEDAATQGDQAAAGPAEGDATAGDTAEAHGAERAALAAQLREAIAARKQADGLMTYDDLLHALRRALQDPGRGAQARQALRQRYKYALIDEFQDTDPVQWEILNDAFRDPDDPDRALVLIGDPKQAIYSFRGADVRAYLAATKQADRRFDLATNYRSDPPVLAAIDQLLTGTRFGEHDIEFRRVRAPEAHQSRRIGDDVDGSALQVRIHPKDKSNAEKTRKNIANDLVSLLVDQLGRVRLSGSDKLLAPEDVAVLVRTNAEATLVQSAMREAGIPSVVNGVGSVLATGAAEDWRWLLDAIERPSDPMRIRRLALSSWIGWGADDFTETRLDSLHISVAGWANVLEQHGIATLEHTVMTEQQVATRLLSQIGGERHLTDLNHVGRLLHVAEREEDRGISGLRAWLQVASAEAVGNTTPPDEQARRLESDAKAVQIVTVHRSKGLQYPVVFVPFQWSPGAGVRYPVAVHDAERSRRVIDVGPPDRTGADISKTAAQHEQLGEQLRLLYVAVTRARHRVVLWWANPWRSGAERSALARTMFRDADGNVPLGDPPSVPDDLIEVLRERFAGASASVQPFTVDENVPDVRWHDHSADTAELSASTFERTLDTRWRRTSYSAILRHVACAEDAASSTAAAPTPAEATPAEATTVATEPDHTVIEDEFDAQPALTLDEPDRPDSQPVPLGGLRGGTEFGTLVHAVFEHLDFTAPDLPAALAEVITQQRREHHVDGIDDDAAKQLADGLVDAITSPLGPLTAVGDGQPLRLADITLADRLDEMEFELPLAGGDRAAGGGDAGGGGADGPDAGDGGADGRDAGGGDAGGGAADREGAGADRVGSAVLGRLADLLARPAADGGLDTDDPLRSAGYPEQLRRPGFSAQLRGYLNGSIDLLVRATGGDGQPRYFIADYKTNKLGSGVPTVDDYHPDALAEAMVHGNYPLQALLYQVATHRFLRWRQPGYDPDVHLGGALYLYVRGMTGDVTADGRPHGVFAWRPPTKLVTDLSDLLDGQLAEETADTNADVETPDTEPTQEALW